MAFSIFAETTEMPHIYTFLDSVAEKKNVIQGEEIEKQHSENLTSVLQSKGIQILSYGSYGLEEKPSIRGFTDETVRVVIDGVLANNAQFGTFDFSSIDIQSIEKIEIVKGGFTEGCEDEGAVGGVIYITTKKQSLGHNFSFDVALKTYFYEKTPLDTISNGFYYDGQVGENTFLKASLKGVFAQNEYFFKSEDGTKKNRENAGVLDGNANFSISHFFSDGNNWTISDAVYLADKKIPGAETAKNYGKQKDANNNLTFNIAFPCLSDYFSLKANASWQMSNRFYEEKVENAVSPDSFLLNGRDGIDDEHHVNTFVLSGISDFSKYDFFSSSLGLTLNYTYLDSTADGNHSLFSGTLKNTTRFYIGKIFSISIPLSIKVSGDNFQFVPKVGFRFGFSKIDFLLSAYRMVQFPTMDDLYWGDSFYATGNRNLKTESGYGGEVSLNGHDIFLPFSVSVWTNYYKNKIQWATRKTAFSSTSNATSSKWSPENVASAFYCGVDLSLEKSFCKFFCIKANFQYLYNRLLDKSNDLTYGKRIMWTPDFTGSLEFSVDTKYVYFLLEGNFIGKRYISNLNATYLDPYFLMNATVELRFFKKVFPYARLENLTNQDYKSVPEYPMSKIALTVGVNGRF